MAPHLTLVEQSRALQASAKGQTPMAVFDTLEKARSQLEFLMFHWFFGVFVGDLPNPWCHFSPLLVWS